MKAFLFPCSTYLAARWWHRLAKVIFWVWFVFVLGYCWNVVVLTPFDSCMNLKIQMEIFQREPSGLDCGTSAVSYFIRNSIDTAAPAEIGVGFIIVIAVLYLALIAPSLLYRLVLYIAKGSTWRERMSAEA